MAQSSAPSLNDLQVLDQPAWLWDGKRGRIVWANPAGVALFGGETLFDLIDRPFDERDPDIARICELTGDLPRGETQSARFDFSASTGGNAAMTCSCSIHSLPDGRAGLLMVSQHIDEGSGEADPALMTGILSAMPIAIAAADEEGRIVFLNAAARDIIPPANRDDLAALLSSQDDANALVERVKSARTLSVLQEMPTNYGQREVRMTVRLLDGEGQNDAGAGHLRAGHLRILLMLEDVTDRRALERALSDNQTAPVPLAAPADTSADPAAGPDTSGPLTEISKAIAAEVAAASPVEPAPQTLPDVPELVSRTLNKLDEAIILHRDRRFYFANNAAMTLLGYTDAARLAARQDLFAALQQPDGTRTSVTVSDAGGNEQQLEISTGKFPWNDGPLVQSNLRAVAGPPTVEPSVRQELETAPVEPPASAEATRQPPPPASASDRELYAILDTASDGIITLDGDGAILSFSAGAEALFGYRLAEVAGKPFSELLAKDNRGVLDGYIAALSDGGIASVFNDGREVRGVVSQGGEISLFMTMARLSGASGAEFCAVLRDITQWKKTEAQLRHDKEVAEQSNAQKSDFLAQISHELRTPLNAILGFSDVMRTERFGEIQNEKYLSYANDIHKGGSHLLALINDLLDLSKVEAGKLELNFTSVNLHNAIDECLNVMQEQATAGRVIVRKSLPNDLPNVVADLRSIKQILLNLLSNAIKFTDPGGQVIISAKLNKAGELKFKIKDTGIGMSQPELQTALEPFRRVETPGRKETTGTGLGLPLTKALTEANRARFDISSERKKGTLVEITFPTTRVLAD